MPSRVIVSLLLAAASLLPGSAAVAAPSTCGGSWSGAGISDCVFKFQGFPLSVHGRVTSTLGAGATVAVWLEVHRPQPAALPGVPVLACAAARVEGTNCTQSIGSPNGLRDLPLGTVLRCRVSGLDYGIYTCSSGPA